MNWIRSVASSGQHQAEQLITGPGRRARENSTLRDDDSSFRDVGGLLQGKCTCQPQLFYAVRELRFSGEKITIAVLRFVV